MANPYYTKVVADAEKIILKRGRQFTLNHAVDAAPVDQSKPWERTESPPQKFTKFGVFTSYDSKDVDGQKIKGTDLKLVFTALGLDAVDQLSNRDTITDSVNGDLSIMDVDLLQPGTDRVLYTLQVRK